VRPADRQWLELVRWPAAWHYSAGRAEEQLTEVLADGKRFCFQQKNFDKSIKVLVANADSLVQDDSEYKDDDTYMDIAR
jgi:hypothetical protein